MFTEDYLQPPLPGLLCILSSLPRFEAPEVHRAGRLLKKDLHLVQSETYRKQASFTHDIEDVNLMIMKQLLFFTPYCNLLTQPWAAGYLRSSSKIDGFGRAVREQSGRI
jgi:hypothetical protein